MSENYDSYLKNLTNIVDFIVLLSNKIIGIINNKISDNVGDLTNLISNSDLIGLKKKHSNWNDIIKNYTTLLTTIFNLVSIDHTLNYTRKMVIKTKETKETKEYLDKKINTFKELSEKFIEFTKTFLICIEFFSKIYETKMDFSNEIKSLGDVCLIVDKTLEKYASKILTFDKILSSKVGKYEEISNNLEIFIQGGFENNIYEVKIYNVKEGANEENIYIGGFKIENYLKQKYIEYELIKKDINRLIDSKDNNENKAEIEKYFQNIHEIIINVNNLVNKPKEILSQMLNEVKILDNLKQQYNSLVVKIFDLLKYHYSRFNLSYELDYVLDGSNTGYIKYNDTYGKINLAFQLDDYQSIKQTVICIHDIYQLITKADHQYILKDVKNTFKFLNQIKNSEEYQQQIDLYQKDYELIKTLDFDQRKKNKNDISNKILEIENLIIDIDKLNVKKDKILLIKNKSFDKKDIIKSLKQFLKNLEYVINVERSYMNNLKKYEKKYDQMTNLLFELISDLDFLINPNNKLTCIKRLSLLFNFGLRSIILDKIKSRFIGYNFEFQKKNIEKILNADLNLFYDKNKLNLDYIDKVISQHLSEL